MVEGERSMGRRWEEREKKGSMRRDVIRGRAMDGPWMWGEKETEEDEGIEEEEKWAIEES